MHLFEPKIRSYMGYSNTLEDTYSFLDRSCGEEFVPVRERLEFWFSHYPQAEQQELKSRFMDGLHFDDAFFELYLHEMYYQDGYQIEIHPSLAHTSKRPDFLISKGEERFYLEARLVRDQSEEERQERIRKDKLVDELNKIKAFPYWIMVRKLEIFTKQSFSVKSLMKAIVEAVKGLDYFKLLEDVSLVPFAYKDENFEMEVLFSPQVNSDLFTDNHTVGGRSYYGAKWVNNSASLQKGILNKANRYGRLDAPLVIAINSLSPFMLSIYDLEKLLGKDMDGVIAENGRDSKGNFNTAEGIFCGKHKNKLSHISSLFITSVSPNHNGTEARYWCINPNYKSPAS